MTDMTYWAVFDQHGILHGRVRCLDENEAVTTVMHHGDGDQRGLEFHAVELPFVSELDLVADFSENTTAEKSRAMRRAAYELGRLDGMKVASVETSTDLPKDVGLADTLRAVIAVAQEMEGDIMEPPEYREQQDLREVFAHAREVLDHVDRYAGKAVINGRFDPPYRWRGPIDMEELFNRLASGIQTNENGPTDSRRKVSVHAVVDAIEDISPLAQDPSVVRVSGLNRYQLAQLLVLDPSVEAAITELGGLDPSSALDRQAMAAALTSAAWAIEVNAPADKHTLVPNELLGEAGREHMNCATERGAAIAGAFLEAARPGGRPQWPGTGDGR